MINLQELEEMQSMLHRVIYIIFEHEKSFKEEVLGKHGWKHDEYSIERCHAANNWRITLKHDDYREKDLYIPSNDVLTWVLDLQDRVKGE
jgi:hypothetical protein